METLRIKVEQIESPRQRYAWPLSRDLLAEALADAPSYSVSAGAEFTAHVTRTAANVLLEGDTRLSVESACRRCLRPVTTELPVTFSLSLVAQPAATQRPVREVEEDTGEGESRGSFDLTEADVEPFDGEIIELGPILREQALLALPTIEPLCSEDCRGLCTTCGRDLNQEDCGHSQRVPDPRWAGLKDIKLN